MYTKGIGTVWRRMVVTNLLFFWTISLETTDVKYGHPEMNVGQSTK